EISGCALAALAEDVQSEGAALEDQVVHDGRALDRDEDQQGLQGDGGEGADRHAVQPALEVGCHDGHAGREVSHGVAEASFVRRGAAPTLTLPRRGGGVWTHARKVSEADSRYNCGVRLVQSEFCVMLPPPGI